MTRLFVGHLEGTATLNVGPVDLAPGVTQFGNSGGDWSQFAIPASASEVDGSFTVDAFSYTVHSGTDDGVQVRMVATAISPSGPPSEIFASATAVAPGQDYAVVDGTLVPGLAALGPFLYAQIDFENPGPHTVNVSIAYTIRYSVGLYAGTADPPPTSTLADASCFINTPPVPGQTPILLGLVPSGATTQAYASVDGLTYSAISSTFALSAQSDTVYGLIYVRELGLWVAGGGGSGGGTHCLYTSPDGVHWTARPSPFDGPTTTNEVCDFAWSPSLGMLLAVGTSSNNPAADPLGVVTDGYVVLCTSTDGITWTMAYGNISPAPFGGSPPGPVGGVAAVWAAALGEFVVGLGGRSVALGNGNNGWLTSSDGTTWTQHTAISGSTDNDFQNSGLAWSPALSLLVAAGIDFNGMTTLTAPAVCFATSPDGTTWTDRPSPFDSGGPRIERVVWDPGAALFVAAGTTHLGYSGDGITWTRVAWIPSMVGTHSFAYAPSIAKLAAGTPANSPDGTTWTVGSSGLGAVIAVGQSVSVLGGVTTSAFCATEGTSSLPTVSGASPTPLSTSHFKP